MKYAVALATVVAVASAAECDTSLIPTCARTILDAQVKSVTGCDVTDYKCICLASNQAKLTAAVTTAVIASCGADKVGEVLEGTGEFCASVAAGCTSGSGSGGSSSAAQSSTSSSAPSSSSSAAESSSAAPTSTTAKPTTSAAPSTTAKPTSSASSGNSTGPKPTTTSGPVQAGASMLTAAGSGLIVAVLGAFALL